MLSSWSHFFASTLHIERGTWLSSTLQTFYAFSISGLAHSILVVTLPITPPFTGMYERFWTMYLFFFFQAAGMVIEDLVRAVVGGLEEILEWNHQNGRTSSLHLWIGRVWVLGWLWWTGQFAVVCWLTTSQGLLTVPFSFAQLALRRFGH